MSVNKFKEGDMVYLIGFNYFKPCTLMLTNCEDLPLKLEVAMGDNDYETFTANGCYTPDDTEPSIVLATEENRVMLNKLLGASRINKILFTIKRITNGRDCEPCEC